jgi:hypothetical protein
MPADGNGAAEKQDFGTSRWQLASLVSSALEGRGGWFSSGALAMGLRECIIHTQS